MCPRMGGRQSAIRRLNRPSATSGAAMIPLSMPESCPLISRLMLLGEGTPRVLSPFRGATLRLVGGAVVAIIPRFFLRETGVAASRTEPRDADIPQRRTAVA